MNRRRERERRDWWHEAATLTRWGGMAASLCLLAMAFVHLRNQQVLAGRRIRDHEERIEELRREIEDRQIAILRLEERSALRARAGEGMVEVAPFSQECIVLTVR